MKEIELGPRLKSIELNTNEHVIWPGAMRNGYGIKKIPGKGSNSTINAHRYVWEQYYNKKIPKGMAIDHKCRERRCINPKHLEVVTHSENNTREWANRKGNWDAKKGTYIKKSLRLNTELMRRRQMKAERQVGPLPKNAPVNSNGMPVAVANQIKQNTKQTKTIKKMDPRLDYKQKRFKQAPSVDAKRLKPKLSISTRESKVMAPSARKILRPLKQREF